MWTCFQVAFYIALEWDLDVALRMQLAGFPANWNLGSSALPVNYVLDAVNYINAARMKQHARALIYLSVCEYMYMSLNSIYYACTFRWYLLA